MNSKMLLSSAFAIVLSIFTGPASTLATLDTSAATTETSVPTLGPLPVSGSTPPVACDKGYLWKPKASGCYKIYLERETWDTAVEKCAADGAKLLVINTEQESKAIYDIMNLFEYSFWRLGVRAVDESNMKLVSVNGEAFSDLYQGNTRRMAVWPGNSCLYINSRNQVAGMPCHATWRFICEKKVL